MATGPKTQLGKSRASKNSRKHEFFAKEFTFSPKERIEFDHLRNGLSEELSPNSPLLQLVFEDLLAAAWRMKLALRCEQVEVKKQLEIKQQENPKALVGNDTPMNSPFVLTPFEIGRRLKFLDDLRDRIAVGYVPQELEKPVRQAFGSAFWLTLNDWAPANPWLMHLLIHSLEKAKAYDFELPFGSPTPEEEKGYAETDSARRIEMMGKLVDLHQQNLLLALQHVQQGTPGGAGAKDRTDRLDLSLRYQTAARGNFYNAFKVYRQLKKARQKSKS